MQTYPSSDNPIELICYTFDQKQDLRLLSELPTEPFHTYWKKIETEIITIAGQENINIVEYPDRSVARKKILILLIKDRDFFESDGILRLINSPIRPIGQFPASDQLDYQPIITIGYEDITRLFCAHTEAELSYNQNIYTEGLDHRIKFLDAGIWHRYVPLYPVEGYFTEQFKTTLRAIKDYHQLDLYASNSARANLEFQLRILQNAYIYPVGEQNHSLVVTPFKFHSETQMRERADEIKRFFSEALEDRLSWHFLLVDDYADEPISGVTNLATTKKSLIKLLLGPHHIEIDHPLATADTKQTVKANIVEKCVSMLHQAANFDVILLDYLLGIKFVEGRESNDSREYGHQFLQELVNDAKATSPKCKRGPYMRYWIFPISSFPFALYDKLRQLGIDNYHHLWHLSGGGDPISTPQAFRYYLLSFMQQQVFESFLPDQELAEYLTAYSEVQDTEKWIDIISKRLANLLAKIEILESNRSSSKFSIELYDFLMSVNGYHDFINSLKSLLLTCKGVISGSHQLRIFPWYTADFSDDLFSDFKLDYSSTYRKTIDLVSQRLQLEFYGPSSKIVHKIKQQTAQSVLEINNLRAKAYFIPKEIGQLGNTLTFLDLSNNKLSQLPETIKELRHLRIINLSNNRFKTFPAVLSHLPVLQEINLNDNPIARLLNEPHPKNRRAVQHLIRYNSIYEIISDLLAKNHFLDALDQTKGLLDIYPTLHQIYLKDLIQLESRFRDLDRQYSNGLISNEFFSKNRNILNEALYATLERMKNELKK